MSCRKNPGNTVIIFEASYGRDSEVCPYKPGKPFPFKQIFEGEGSKDPPGLRCEEDVTKMIDKRCGWKKACNVSVTSSVSDLCGPEANQYLSVAYSCGKAVSKVNTPPRAHPRTAMILTISVFCPFSPISKPFVITASTDSHRIIPEPRLRGT